MATAANGIHPPPPRTDPAGRVCLTDLWRSAGSVKGREPKEFLRSPAGRRGCGPLAGGLTAPVIIHRQGADSTTFALRPIAEAYGSWLRKPVRRRTRAGSKVQAELFLDDTPAARLLGELSEAGAPVDARLGGVPIEPAAVAGRMAAAAKPSRSGTEGRSAAARAMAVDMLLAVADAIRGYDALLAHDAAHGRRLADLEAEYKLLMGRLAAVEAAPPPRARPGPPAADGYATIAGFAGLNGISLDQPAAQAAGRRLAIECERRGWPIRRLPIVDEAGVQVSHRNAYPPEALAWWLARRQADGTHGGGR